MPYRQVPVHAFTLVVRRAANPLGLAAQLRQEVLALDRQQPIARLGLLSEMVDRSLAARRFQMLPIGSLALLALALASLGVYGVMSYAPAVFALGCATLLGVSMLAAYLPARRAAEIDPAITLRAE